MTNKLTSASRMAVPAVLAVLALGTAAVAGPYPGSLKTLTNGAGDTRNLFTVTGDTVTVTGDTSGTNTYFLDGVQLVGFRSLYLVQPNGNATSGITTLSSGGFVYDGPNGTKTFYNGAPTYDGVPTLGGYTGYDDNAPGKGFPDASHFLVIANPALATKTTFNNDILGSFGFSKPVGTYDIGLDYILKGGATGRGYFALPRSPLTAVPEPGTMASFLVGGLGLAGLLLRARRHSAQAA